MSRSPRGRSSGRRRNLLALGGNLQGKIRPPAEAALRPSCRFNRGCNDANYYGVMPKNVSLVELRSFKELGDCGHFTRAADRLSITPSALSRRISKLEAALGARLIERTTRAGALTAVGSNFHVRLSGLLLSLDDCLGDVSRFGSDARTSGPSGNCLSRDGTKPASR